MNSAVFQVPVGGRSLVVPPKARMKSKIFNELTVHSTVVVAMTSQVSGKVTYRNRCQAVAPASSHSSYRYGGIWSTPAMMIVTYSPVDIHTMPRQTISHRWSPRKFGRSIKIGRAHV